MISLGRDGPNPAHRRPPRHRHRRLGPKALDLLSLMPQYSDTKSRQVLHYSCELPPQGIRCQHTGTDPGGKVPRQSRKRSLSDQCGNAEPGASGGRSPDREGLSGELVAEASPCYSNSHFVKTLCSCFAIPPDAQSTPARRKMAGASGPRVADASLSASRTVATWGFGQLHRRPFSGFALNSQMSARCRRR